MSFAPALRARVAPAFSPGAPGYDPCHDVFHLDRVARNARALALAEKGDVDVVESAAYLHDLDRTGEASPLDAARAHLAAVGAPADFAARVMEAVERHKDKSFAPGGVRPRSLEAAILSDADKLEAIGAIGVARAFSFGGLKQRPLWDDAAASTIPRSGIAPGASGSSWARRHPLIDELAARAPAVYVSGAKGTTIAHFFEKLLRLQGDFATETGKRLAAQRHAFLEAFLTEFFEEWFAAAP